MAGLSFVWLASKCAINRNTRRLFKCSTTLVRQMELPYNVCLPMPCCSLSYMDYTQ